MDPIWTQLPGSPAGDARNHDISIVGEDMWTARGQEGIYRSTNGGVSWTQIMPQTNRIAHYRCIGFASATRGWLGNLGPGSYDTAVTDTNALYETFDGGLTWAPVSAISAAGVKGLCALHVKDAQHIYGGGRVRGPAYFIKSTDGGTNWSVTNLTAGGIMGAIMDVYFHDDLNGFVAGMDTTPWSFGCNMPYYHGRIARTTDGGETWTTAVDSATSCAYFWKMAWPSTNVGYATLQDNSGNFAALTFFKTTNGGVSWFSNSVPLSTIGYPGEFTLQGIGFVSESEGWMGGPNTTTEPRNFLHTLDGGLTWSTVGYSDTRKINRIRFISPTLGYASGAKLHVYRIPIDIADQPQGQWVSPGVNVDFSVGASGNPPFFYQWQKGGVDIGSATNMSYSLTNASRSDSGDYTVVVTNAYGSVTSSVAHLRVFTPEILTGPTPSSSNLVSVTFRDSPSGVMNSNYIPFFTVLASSNLVDWEVLDTSISVTNDSLIFHDSASYSKRFYRVLEQ